MLCIIVLIAAIGLLYPDSDFNYCEPSTQLHLIKISMYLDCVFDDIGSFPKTVVAGTEGLPEYWCAKEIYINAQENWYPDSGDVYDLFYEVDCELKIHRSLSLQYMSNGIWYIIISRGPDLKFSDNYLEYIYNDNSAMSVTDISVILNENAYNPTNGTVSNGDIFSTSHDLGYYMDHDKHRL